MAIDRSKAVAPRVIVDEDVWREFKQRCRDNGWNAYETVGEILAQWVYEGNGLDTEPDERFRGMV